MRLRPALFSALGSLILALSILTGIVFINLQHVSAVRARHREMTRAALLILDRFSSPRERIEAARLAGLSAFAWREAGGSWQGDDPPPKRDDGAVQSMVRWYGHVPEFVFAVGIHTGTEWRAAASLRAETTAIGQGIRLLSFYLLLNAAAAVMLGAVLLTRLVLRPVNRLAETMSVLPSPEDFRPIAPARRDEIGELTEAFNALMQRLAEAEQKRKGHLAELQAAYQRLAEAQERLIGAEKLAALGRLSAGIAHEIGNPLSAISGYLDLLPSLNGVERDEVLCRAKAEADRIDRIIRGLLGLARARIADEKPVHASAFLGETIRAIQAQPLFREIRIETEFASDLPEILTAQGRLGQVLVNLCINAADAMGRKGRITIRAVRSERGVRIEVTDAGPGIDPQDLPHIFEPFFTTKRQGEGTGLGLAISYQIVTSLGGTLMVESRAGAGATFIIDLPKADGQ